MGTKDLTPESIFLAKKIKSFNVEDLEEEVYGLKKLEDELLPDILKGEELREHFYSKKHWKRIKKDEK